MNALLRIAKRILTSFGLFLFAAFNLNAQAQVYLDSNFTGADPSFYSPWTNVDYIDPNFIYSGWSVNPNGLLNGTVSTKGLPGGYIFPNGSVNDAFAFYVCGPGDASDSTLAFAMADNQYIHFQLSPASGSINLNSKKIIFKIKRIGYNSPRIYSVFTSLGGFQEGNQLFTTTTMGKGDYTETEFSFIMPATGYGNITGPIQFRVYAYAAAYCYNGTSLTDFRIEEPAPLYNLTLSSGPNGSVATNPEGTVFEQGRVVQLLATPNPGYRFAGWSGDVNGMGNPRSVTIGSNLSVTGNFVENTVGEMEVGMNLDKIDDWSTSRPFVDAFKMAREWMTRSVGGWEWHSDKTNEIPTDQNGWPLYLPFVASDNTQHYVHTIVSTKPLVAGNYTVIVDGTGIIRLAGMGDSGDRILNGGTTSFSLSIDPALSEALFLRIYQSSAIDPVRNIKIIRPGYESVHETQTFQTTFLDRLRPFSVIRYMDWGKTNGSPVVSWGDRTLKVTYTQTLPQGVALEYMVELANTLNKDFWVCIPHKADDNYVRQAARLLRDSVGPDQKIYVEYSNETWNWHYDFSQTTYVQDKGVELNLDSDRWTAGQKYAVLRSIQIWKIFREEFLSDQRIIRVMGAWVGLPSNTYGRISFLNDPAINPDYIMPDVLAIAPYFGKGYTINDIPPIAASYPTLDEIFNITGPESINQVQGLAREHKAIADAQGLKLVAYEGGQGSVGIDASKDDQVLTDILFAANRDQRMYPLYTQYLNMLKDEGLNLFAHYSDIGNWSKNGFWGALEYLEQPTSTAPNTMHSWTLFSSPIYPPLSPLRSRPL